MKKILFVHHSASWGGSVNSLVELVTSLDENKYKPIVLLLKKSIIADILREKHINFILAKSFFYQKYYRYFVHSEAGYVKWYQILKFSRVSLSWFLSRFIFAKRELTNIDYDIAHLNSSVLTDWLAPCKTRGKTIIHIREPFRKRKFDFRYYFFRGQMKKYADKIIAISKDNAKRINLPEKTFVIYNYTNKYSRYIKDSSYSSRKFLYLGGSSRLKGFYIIVNALKYLDENINVVFAGKYATLSKDKSLRSIIKRISFYDLKKQKAIKTIENCKNAQIIGMINNISNLIDSVCCMISPFNKPHFSRPVIEGYLHKKPAIGSDVEGMDEIIQHNKTGILFSKNDSKDLARAINYIANHPEEAKQFGEEGFRIAEKRFTSANVRQIESLYLELLPEE